MEMHDLVREELLPKLRTHWEKYIGYMPDEEILTIDPEDGFRLIINVQIHYETANNHATGYMGFNKSMVMYSHVHEGIGELVKLLDEFIYNYRDYTYNREEFPGY